MKPALYKLSSGTAITVTVEQISPTVAAAYLTSQARNRKLRPRHLAALVRDMERGDFAFTASGISFDADGALIDGQHRLSGIVQSGVTLSMFVFRGFPADAQNSMDLGASRTVWEQLGMDGVGNSTIICAYANAIARGFCIYSNKVNLAQTRSILDTLPHIATQAKLDRPELKCRASAYLGTIALSLHVPGKAVRMAKFFDAFARGIGIANENSPAYRLQQYYNTKGGGSGNQAVRDAASYTADCLEAWAAEQDMPTTKPTGTGMAWLRRQLATQYAAIRNILGFKS